MKAEFIWLWLGQVVRHSDAFPTYAPTYWPKDDICAGYIDCSIKFCRNPFALRLAKFTAHPTESIFPLVAAQCTTHRAPIKPASHFSGDRVRWISSRISSARILTSLQICFNMSAKVCWILSVRLTFVTYVFRIDPTGVLMQ